MRFLAHKAISTNVDLTAAPAEDMRGITALLRGQSTAIQNGLYRTTDTAWVPVPLSETAYVLVGGLSDGDRSGPGDDPYKITPGAEGEAPTITAGWG